MLVKITLRVVYCWNSIPESEIELWHNYEDNSFRIKYSEKFCPPKCGSYDVEKLILMRQSWEIPKRFRNKENITNSEKELLTFLFPKIFELLIEENFYSLAENLKKYIIFINDPKCQPIFINEKGKKNERILKNNH